MSNKVVVGSIPEKICYVFAPQKTVSVGCEWDMDYGFNSKNITEEVIPVFPADNNDNKMLNTAKNWAKYERNQNKDEEPDTDIVNNDFIKDIKILSLEHRGNGGRAYKAVIGKYYVDVREDVVIDTMLQEGVRPGGILNGEFIWSKIGSQMKLIRKDSELYKLVIEFQSKKDLKPFSKKNLDIGGVYRTKKKERFLYLGNVNTTKFNVPDIPPISKTTYGLAKYNEEDPKFLNFEKIEMKNLMLFYRIYKSESISDAISEMTDQESYYRFDFKKNHTLIEKIDQISLDKDIISQIASIISKPIKNSILEYTGHKPPKEHYQKISTQNLSQKISNYSMYLNMYSAKDTKPEDFDVQKYLLFS